MKWFPLLEDALAFCRKSADLVVFVYEFSSSGARKFVIGTVEEIWMSINTCYQKCSYFYEVYLDHFACEFYLDIEIYEHDNLHISQKSVLATLTRQVQAVYRGGEILSLIPVHQ